MAPQCAPGIKTVKTIFVTTMRGKVKVLPCVFVVKYIVLVIVIPSLQNVGAIMDSLCRVCPSVGPSVGRSVRLHYRVRSINPIEGFSLNLAKMFISTRGCAEPMLPMCQLKLKITNKGRISNNQILDIMSCPLCKSYTN